MKFQTHHDIQAPIDYVFQRATNFDNYERQALRHGAHVVRLDAGGPVTVGSAWDVAFTYRGKDRQLRATITELQAPSDLAIETVVKGLTSHAKVTFLALSQQTTRVDITISLGAKSLSARLLLQSLKLAKSTLNGRFRKRVKEQLRAIEADYQSGRGASS